MSNAVATALYDTLKDDSDLDTLGVTVYAGVAKREANYPFITITPVSDVPILYQNQYIDPNISLGTEDPNTFTRASQSKAETARDDFANDVANVDWFASYNNDDTEQIRLAYGSTVVIQRRVWENVDMDIPLGTEPNRFTGTSLSDAETARDDYANDVANVDWFMFYKDNTSLAIGLIADSTAVLQHWNSTDNDWENVEMDILLGTEPNRFTGASLSDAETERDDYANDVANSSWFTSYNDDTSPAAIWLIADSMAVLQHRVWENVVKYDLSTSQTTWDLKIWGKSMKKVGEIYDRVIEILHTDTELSVDFAASLRGYGMPMMAEDNRPNEILYSRVIECEVIF